MYSYQFDTATILNNNVDRQQQWNAHTLEIVSP